MPMLLVNEGRGQLMKRAAPYSEAYDLVNEVEIETELADLPIGLIPRRIRLAMMDERFFELWAEGTSGKTDMIRGERLSEPTWCRSTTAKPELKMPIPRQPLMSPMEYWAESLGIRITFNVIVFAVLGFDRGANGRINVFRWKKSSGAIMGHRHFWCQGERHLGTTYINILNK